MEEKPMQRALKYIKMHNKNYAHIKIKFLTVHMIVYLCDIYY